MPLWRTMIYVPVIAIFLALGARRVTVVDTSFWMFGSPGWCVEYDAGPAMFVAYRTVRTGLSVEIWPYWRPAIVLYRRP